MFWLKLILFYLQSPIYLFKCPIFTVIEFGEWQKILWCNHFMRFFSIYLLWLRLGFVCCFFLLISGFCCYCCWHLFFSSSSSLTQFFMYTQFLFTFYVVLCEAKILFFLYKTKRLRRSIFTVDHNLLLNRNLKRNYIDISIYKK